VQLGQLQETLTEFDERGATVVVVSVDPPETSLEWAQKRGFAFPLASDPELRLIRALDLENPEHDGLALHAVFIVDEDGRIFYRKIARRRASAQELLDAIDHRYARGM
jgi:peroxiredoxin